MLWCRDRQIAPVTLGNSDTHTTFGSSSDIAVLQWLGHQTHLHRPHIYISANGMTPRRPMPGRIDPMNKLATVAERLRRLSPEVEPCARPERRGPERPWANVGVEHGRLSTPKRFGAGHRPTAALWKAHGGRMDRLSEAAGSLPLRARTALTASWKLRHRCRRKGACTLTLGRSQRSQGCAARR